MEATDGMASCTGAMDSAVLNVQRGVQVTMQSEFSDSLMNRVPWSTYNMTRTPRMLTALFGTRSSQASWHRVVMITAYDYGSSTLIPTFADD